MATILRLTALATTVALALTACAGEVDDAARSPGPTDTGTAAGAELGLVEEGVLTVCSDIPYEPFEFEDRETGETTGFDIELMRAAAEDLDLVLEVRGTSFEVIESGAALAAGQCDVAASAMTITEDRQRNLNFSQPYFTADQSLLIRKEDAQKYRGLDDLAGEVIGVQAGTTGAEHARTHTPRGATVKDYPTAAALFAALAGGQIEAILQDFPVNAFQATKNPDVVVTEKFPTNEQYGFAVAEQGSEELLRAINRSLEELRDDGSYDRLFRTYFGEPSGGEATAQPRTTASPS